MPKIFFYQLQNLELLVENGNPRGGSAVQTLVWMEAFHELGYEVFQSRLENDHRKLLPEFSWVKTIQIYHPKKNKKRLTWFTHRFPSIYSAIKNSNCDILYISIPNWTTFFLGLICLRLKVKQIVRVANDNILDERINLTHSKINAFFMLLGFKTCYLILAQNEFQFNNLKNNYPNKRINKIFNPIIINKKHLNNKLNFQGYIGWVANFRYQKNLSLLFDIAMKLENENFKIAGVELFPMDTETEDCLLKLKKLQNVNFVGNIPRKEIFSFFSEAKFLLNTSRYEGFSNTFLEAMMTGTPILSTGNVNPDGIIDTFGLGYIYNDENDLKQILNGISETEYLQKSKNCIEYVKNNHDHLALGKKLLDFLKE